MSEGRPKYRNAAKTTAGHMIMVESMKDDLFFHSIDIRRHRHIIIISRCFKSVPLPSRILLRVCFDPEFNRKPSVSFC